MSAEILESTRNIVRPIAWLRQPAGIHRAGSVLPAGAVIRQMTQRLAFKDAVIQESHHRVKNTLQTASALLSMQARGHPNAEVASALKLGSDRLITLAAVHEMLYQHAGDGLAVPLRPLLAAIVRSFKEPTIPGRRQRVLLRVSAVDIAMSSDQAIPLALIANEAISNAHKHAFPDLLGALWQSVSSRRLMGQSCE